MKNKSTSSAKNYKKVWLLFIGVAAVLAMLGVAFSSWASGRWSQSDSFDYIEVERSTDSSSRYIDWLPIYYDELENARKNYRSSCNQQAFVDYAERITYSARRVDYDKDIKDKAADIAVICFRIGGWGSGKYLYRSYHLKGAYGAPQLDIVRLDYQGKNIKSGGNIIKIWVGGPTGGTVEYIPLLETGQVCEAAAFEKTTIKPFEIQPGSEVDLRPFGLAVYRIDQSALVETVKYPAVALCFRAKQDVEYYYKKYGDQNSGIFFAGGYASVRSTRITQEVQEKDSDLSVRSSAHRLDWAPLKPGQTCDGSVFVPSWRIRGTDVRSGLGGTSFKISAAVLASLNGLCFKANYGNGNLIYKAHHRFDSLAQLRVAYKFLLTATQENDGHEFGGSFLAIDSNEAIH